MHPIPTSSAMSARYKEASAAHFGSLLLTCLDLWGLTSQGQPQEQNRSNVYMYTSLPVILEMSDKKTPDLYRGRSGEPYRLCCTSMHVCGRYAPIYITALHCASTFSVHQRSHDPLPALCNLPRT